MNPTLSSFSRRAFLRLSLFTVLATLLLGTGVASRAQTWAWGWNTAGQLGDGTKMERAAPVEIPGLTEVKQTAGGSFHSLVLKSDGTVWAWGSNVNGQLGDGTKESRTAPVQVSGLTGVTQVAAGGYYSLALKSDGTVWAWGVNNYGQLGDGTKTQRTAPVQVSGLTGITQIAAGSGHSLAVKSDGTVWAWGYNGSGQLGDGTNTNRSTPVQASGLMGITQVAAGEQSLALKSDGTVWAWGDNQFGQLGDGTDTSRNTPVQVSGLTGITQVAAGVRQSLAVKSDGTAWAWGGNQSGELGDGTNTDRTTPVQVSGLTGVMQMAGSYHSLALKSDGTVWAWGDNYNGELGDGTKTNRNAPVQVSGLTGITQVAAGTFHSLALIRATLKTAITVVNASSVYGKFTLTATLKDAGGKTLEGKTIAFTVDGIAAGTATTNASGKAAHTVENSTDFGAGAHKYAASFAGDADYKAATATATLTITKADTSVAMPSFAGRLGSTQNLFASLRRLSDKALLVNTKLTFKVDGISVGTASTDGTGKATRAYKIVGLSVGDHALTAEYAGNANQNASSIAATLTVNKSETQSYINNYTNSLGDTRNLTASLKRKTDKVALADKLMTFKLDGSVLGTATTDASGNAKFAYKVAGLTVGDHAIKVEFAGDAEYEPTTASAALTIAKGKTKLGASANSGTVGETATLYGALSRTTDGMKLAGKTIKFKLGGIALGSATTDDAGKATIAYVIDERIPAGVAVLSTSFEGDADYVSSSGAGTLTINKAKAKLATKSMEGVRGTTVALTATLTRVGDNSPLKGRKVRFQIDGTDVGTATTDANGLASLSYAIPSTATLGNHPKSVIFDGDGYYLAYTGAGTNLTVK